MYGGTRMCFLRANTGSFVAKNLMPLLPRLASKHDIVLLNFGLHSNDNGSLWGYIQELEAFGEQYEQHKQQMPQFLWRQTSVQHFDTPIGDHRYSPFFRFFPGAQPDAGLRPENTLTLRCYLVQALGFASCSPSWICRSIGQLFGI
jgi:hypothetical protein